MNVVFELFICLNTLTLLWFFPLKQEHQSSTIYFPHSVVLILNVQDICCQSVPACQSLTPHPDKWLLVSVDLMTGEDFHAAQGRVTWLHPAPDGQVCLPVSYLRAYWLRLPDKGQHCPDPETLGWGLQFMHMCDCVIVGFCLSGREYGFLIRQCRGHADVNITQVLMCCEPRYIWMISHLQVHCMPGDRYDLFSFTLSNRLLDGTHPFVSVQNKKNTFPGASLVL